MSAIPTEIISAVKTAFEAQRKQIIKWCGELVVEGFTKTKYDVTYIRWDDMARYMVDGTVSCWGPDIADTSSYYCTPGIFVDEHDGMTITNAALVQVLTRVQTTNATTCIAFKRAGGEVDYLYKYNDALTVMTHEGLVVNVTMANNWAVKGKEVTAEAASKIETCISEKMAQRFTHEGRDVWAIPDGSSSARLFNYIKQGGDTDGCFKKNVPVFKEDLTSKLRPDLAERITSHHLNSMNSMRNSESFMLDASTFTMSVVVATDSINFTVLNYGGVGKHAKIKYYPGMQIPLFSIRSPNLNERLSKVGLDRVKVCNDAKMVNLADIASKAGDYASKFGLAAGTDLSTPSDRQQVNTIRMQVSIVPASQEGKPTEVYEKIYDYQTRDDTAPTALYSYHTSFGTTFTTSGGSAIKVQPCTYDGSKLSAFNLSVEASKKVVGDDDTYTAADNQENIDAGFGMAIPLGPLGFPKVANATLLTQWPVTAKPMARAAAASSGPTFDEEEEEEDDEPCYRSRSLSGMQYRSLSASAGPAGGMQYRSLSTSAANPASGQLFASRMGLGTYQGEGRGIKNPDLTRRTNSNPTMTYTRFYSLDAPEGQTDRSLPPGMYCITKDQLKTIVKMMDEMYDIAGNAHRLTDPEAVSVQKITAPEFAKTPYGKAGLPVAPMDVEVEPVTEDGTPPKRPRIEIDEVQKPKMVMVDY
tara:strand:+ start:336 stop:2432 length:2097 start_codon:yes stop_codon:yes gene_type:complete